MSALNEIVLAGCTPEPLMAYLKALGILRLVAEQADREAKGCWRNGQFVLRTRLDREGLIEFFLERYQPTPIVAPWGGRSGFFPGSAEKSAREALGRIRESKVDRLQRFRDVVVQVTEILSNMGIDNKASDEGKLAVMRSCRAQLPDYVLPWLDTTYVLTVDGRKYPPLLGTGGNEGSGSYVSGFAQLVVACLLDRRHDISLSPCLFGGSTRDVLTPQTPGHFSAFASRGVNMGQGLAAECATNPWDYALCMEGTCLWASVQARVLDSEDRGSASFPFTTEPSPVGQSGIAAKDRIKPKDAKRSPTEMWLPVWKRFASPTELRLILSEGRATCGERPARTGLDFARAAASLGTDRGLDAFYRVCFLMRNGRCFFATSLGRFEVLGRPDTDLIREIDPWLGRLADLAVRESSPPRLSSALRRIESSIFDYCREGGTKRFSEIVCALGHAEREIEVTCGRVGNSRSALRPLAGLSVDWIRAANDGSPEFEIALALAGISDPERKIGPVRTNLEATTWPGHEDWRGSPSWTNKRRATVGRTMDVVAGLAAILEHRLADGQRLGCAVLPLVSTDVASLQAVSAFLHGEVNDERVGELLWGLTLLNQRRNGSTSCVGITEAPPLPRSFALLRLLFLPGLLATDYGEVTVRPEARVVPLLRAGRLDEACAIAARRLRASGLTPMPTMRGRCRDVEWKGADAAVSSRRLAAALLIPISPTDAPRLVALVVRPQTELENAAR